MKDDFGVAAEVVYFADGADGSQHSPVADANSNGLLPTDISERMKKADKRTMSETRMRKLSMSSLRL